MAQSFVVSVVGKLAGFAMNPLWGQVEYMFFYDSKIETLRRKLEILKNRETDVQQLVLEKTRSAVDIKPWITDWLVKVVNLEEQASEILESAENSEMQCLFHTCPNLKTRYSLGKKATKKTAEAAKLLEEAPAIQDVGIIQPLVQTLHLKPGDFGPFETRISTKKQIMEALKDQDNVSIIRICGMPGAGKTTMAKKIANEVKDNKLFDEVAFAVVSHDPNVIKIQGQLAEMLGLRFEEVYNETVRAERLRVRLGGKSILIILDDVWEHMDLEAIGIPSVGVGKGLRILLTSRIDNVCTKMEAQRIIEINVLSEDESWELFKEKADIFDDATDVIKGTAKEVARECGGLPLALVIIGSALCGKPECEWENALEELKNSSATNIDQVLDLIKKIEFSIDRVSGEQRAFCYSLCFQKIILLQLKVWLDPHMG